MPDSLSNLVMPDIEQVQAPLCISIGDTDLAWKIQLVNQAKEIRMLTSPKQNFPVGLIYKLIYCSKKIEEDLAPFKQPHILQRHL